MATTTKSSPHNHIARGEGTHGQTVSVVPRSGLIYTVDATVASHGKGTVASANGTRKSSNASLRTATKAGSSGNESTQPRSASIANLHGNVELGNSDQPRHSDVTVIPRVVTLQNSQETKQCSSSNDSKAAFSADVTLHADYNSGSSNGGSEDSIFRPPPLPPVPWEMAEAIKRQQKGAGAVRYWRAKHAQAADGGGQPNTFRSGFSNGGHDSSGCGGGGGGVPSYLFPTLRHFNNDPGSVNGVTDHRGVGGGEWKGGRGKTQGWRQRGRENLLVPSRTTLFSGSLGHHPPLAASYKRSVTSLDTLLPNPFSQQQQQQQPPLYSSYSNNFHNHKRPLHVRSGIPPLQPASSGENGDTLPRVQGQGQGQGEVKDNSAVSDLTCLQLADTILGTKTADLPRFHQLCQTKIRYMDFLERSADAAIATEDTTAQKPSGNNQTDKARNKLPYSLRPRGLLDLAHPATPRTASKLPSNSDCEDAQEEGVGDGTGGAANDRPSVSLPSLPAAGTGLLSQGRRSGSAVNNSNFWAPSSSLSNNAPTEGGADTLTGHPAYVPQAPLGKPILKPPSQDATASSDTRCNDPFSPRSVPLDSSHPEQNILVRGTTLFPFSPSNRWSSDASVPRRTHSSKGTADLRRRAVRFSISDQVREFTPSEPLLP